MIHNLVTSWRRANYLDDFSFEEVLSVAYLEAARILENRFDPDRGTASTYLSRYLYGFVQYRLIRDTGKRKTRTGWISPSRRDPPSRQRETAPTTLAELDELVSSMHPDLQEIARRLADGDSLEDVVADSFDTPDEEIEDAILELRNQLRRVILRLHDDPLST